MIKLDRDDNYYIELFGDHTFSNTGEKVPVGMPMAYCSIWLCQCLWEGETYSPDALGFCYYWTLDQLNVDLDRRRGQDEDTGY